MKYGIEVIEETPGIPGIIESLEQQEHCLECGHPWLYDEPAHYTDCRYYFAGEETEEEAEEGGEVIGWRSFRPPLL